MKMRSELQGVLVQETREEGVVEVAPKVHVQLHILRKRFSRFSKFKVITSRLTADSMKKRTTSMLDLPSTPLSSSSSSSSLLLDSSSQSYMQMSSALRFLKSFLAFLRMFVSSTLKPMKRKFCRARQFDESASRWEESRGPACGILFKLEREHEFFFNNYCESIFRKADRNPFSNLDGQMCKLGSVWVLSQKGKEPIIRLVGEFHLKPETLSR